MPIAVVPKLLSPANLKIAKGPGRVLNDFHVLVYTTLNMYFNCSTVHYNSIIVTT
jgi:hypothetical protein